jgi:hypothetical protein
MAEGHIATLTLDVDPDALGEIIESGRLLEFTNTVASNAVEQISAQLVRHVVEGGAAGGPTAKVEYVVVSDGEPGYGTVPRRPPWVHVPIGGAATQEGVLD